ncbi:RhuM family protein [Microbacterium sp.]|uniref:RhuM family protein n=1 Tax=Microbacterium sp. TaxID=51671 RepID=UPI003A915C80
MHLRNVFSEGELDRAATSKDFLQVREEGGRSVRRDVTHYNLDAIISVGYRVKSGTATQFRIWATQRLREYLIRGYAVNERRLEQLGQIVQVLSRSSDEVLAGVAEVLSGYLPSLRVLRDYDEGLLDVAPGGAEATWTLTYDVARAVIDDIRAEFPDDALFGAERGDALRGVIATIYQGFAGQDLYPTVQAKAANLLYLIVKDHPLSDGNKRSAAALFVHFLAHNGWLQDAAGRVRITNNALAAITLMVALSDPKEKDTMVALVQRLLLEDAT